MTAGEHECAGGGATFYACSGWTSTHKTAALAWSHKFESDAELIDGKAKAATIRKETAAEVAALKEKTGKA